MSKNLEQINAICSKDSRLSRLSLRAKNLNKLNYILQQVMPAQFSSHCYLANVNEHTLVIHADNASYASLLRFHAKVLCAAVSEHQPQIVNKLEVKVRAKSMPLKSEATSSLSLPNNAANSLRQMAEDMEDGSLKVALNNLANR